MRALLQLFKKAAHRNNKTHSFDALNEVSFSVNKGHSLGIIGLNGSGKSTLLQIISGTLQPSSGNFHVDGNIVALLELTSGFNPEFTGMKI